MIGWHGQPCNGHVIFILLEMACKTIVIYASSLLFCHKNCLEFFSISGELPEYQELWLSYSD